MQAGLKACTAGVLLLALASPVVAQDKGPIVFVGSSIFHRWTGLQAQMAPLPVVNLAFDGAQTADWNALIDSRVLPLKPRAVVYYCGSNDVDAGDTAGRIVARIRQFIDRVTAALPDARVVFVSVNRAPEKRDRWDEVDGINRRLHLRPAAYEGFAQVLRPVLAGLLR